MTRLVLLGNVNVRLSLLTDLRGRQGRAPGSKSFHFHAVLGKFG